MQYHHIYHIRNVPVYVRILPSRDIAIWHPFNEYTRSVVEGICRNHGRWHGKYKNWIVFSVYKNQVIDALNSAGDQ